MRFKSIYPDHYAEILHFQNMKKEEKKHKNKQILICNHNTLGTD